MFYSLSKFFLYAAAVTPLLLVKQLFFPFIAGKAITFRVLVELALLSFLLHVISHARTKGFLNTLAQKLRHPIVICVSIFAVLFVVTALVGVNPTQSFWSNFERGEGAFQVLHYAVFFILCVLLLADRKSLERMLLVNIFVSLPMCLYAFLQLVTPIGSPNWFVISPGDRVSGTLGNPSYLAAYLIFILAFIVYFFLKSKDPVIKTLLGVLFAFEFFIFLKTGTRGAFLGLIAGLLLIAAIQFFITRNKKVRIGLGAFFALGILLTGTFFATHQAKVWEQVPVLNRLIDYKSAINDIRPRIWTWGSAVSGTLERPVAGWGAENFPYPFDKYYNPNHFGIESFFDRTHNIFLEYLITGGVILLVSWLAIFFFYYKRLASRPKDLWFTILAVTPVIYLIQGFFLFDTLPIYIGFFVFLALMLGTEQERETPLLPERSGTLGGTNLVIAVVLVAACGALIYYTAFLPIMKNRLIVRALILQNTFTADISRGVKSSVTPSQIINGFHAALTYSSPIGQEEAVGMYEKFILAIIENASQNPRALADKQTRADVKTLVDDANQWYDTHLGLYSGLKEQYINGGLNLRAGLSFNYPEYLERGKKMFNQAMEIAPSRLEFMRVLMELARIENDRDTFEKWLRRANLYRPDLFTLDALKSSTAPTGTPAR
jgi:O-antigen ligase